MEITHDKTRHMFEFTENGSSAVVEYKPFDGGINILHTFPSIFFLFYLYSHLSHRRLSRKYSGHPQRSAQDTISQRDL